jgi:hypothetical protein
MMMGRGGATLWDIWVHNTRGVQMSEILDVLEDVRRERNDLASRIERAKAQLDKAYRAAGGRWCEWGERAESVEAMLEDVRDILSVDVGQDTPPRRPYSAWMQEVDEGDGVRQG